jgi:outer membrane protein assembly factor BamB
MVAVDSDLGRVIWRIEVGEAVDGAPAFADGDLYFGASDGALYAVDAGGGGSIWSFRSGGALDSTPAVTAEDVVFGSASGELVCLDRATGAPRWRFVDDDAVLRVTRGLHPPVKGQSSPLVVGETAYAGFQNGRVSAVRMADGTAEWTTDLAADEVRHTDVDETPVPVGDGLLVASFAGGLYLVDRLTGAVRWRSDLRGATRPVSYRNAILTTTVDGELVSLNAEDGTINFRLRLEDRAPGRVQLLGDYAIVPTTQGGLYVLDAAGPHIHARFAPTDGFASATITSRGRVVALDNRGVLHGLTLRYR